MGTTLSLREAIADADATSGAQTITFDSTVFATAQTITLTSGQLVLTKNSGLTGSLTITGPGSSLLSISGNGASRDFFVGRDSATLANLTVSGGAVSSSYGGGLEVIGGTLTLTGCVITGNSAKGGGGLYLSGSGSASLTNCTISSNTASAAGGGIWSNTSGTLTLLDSTLNANMGSTGGGLINVAGSATLTDCTISGNTSAGTGGGIDNEAGLNLINCTINGNSAAVVNGGGGLYDTIQGASLLNTIIAGNLQSSTPSDVGGTVAVTGTYNLIGTGGSDGLTGGVNHNLFGLASPLLGTLNYRGNATQNLPLLPGSPAIDAGTATGAPSTDQRGLGRVGSVDIGADECQGFTLSIASGNNQSAQAGSPFNTLVMNVAQVYSGDAITNGVISFAPPSSGATAILSTTSATISLGKASVNAAAGSTVGSYKVTASTAGGTSTPLFSLTNTVAPSLPSWVASGGTATYNSSTNTLTITGTATIIADPGRSVAPLIVASGTAAKLTISPSTVGFVNLGRITLTGGASIVVPSVGAGRTHINHNVIVLDSNGSTVPTFSIDSASKLDLADNDLIIQNGASEISSVQAATTLGRDIPKGNIWDGNGLTSSSANSIATSQDYEQNLLALTVNGNLPLGQYGTWQAGTLTLALTANDVIVKYTYNGDFDFNGLVDANDAAIFSAFYGSAGVDFTEGDTNGDGNVDANDAGFFAGAYYGLGTGGSNGKQL